MLGRPAWMALLLMWHPTSACMAAEVVVLSPHSTDIRRENGRAFFE